MINRKLVLAMFFLILPLMMQAQSETTNALVKKLDGAGLNLYFYKNTLRMLNQTNSKDFDEMIKNIEKLRFMMIDKPTINFSAADYKKLVLGYESESFEEIMTTRMDGRNFDVLLKDKKGSSLGTVILVSDSSRLYVMDMVGTIDLKKATSLFSKMDESTDIGNKIKDFLNKDKKSDGDKERKPEIN